MKNTFLFSFLLIGHLLVAQKHDYNWILGSFESSNVPNRNGNIINFAGDTVRISIFEKNFDIGRFNGTYSDTEGNLIFWSNGCSLFDPESQIIENGDSLNPGLVYDFFSCSEPESLGYSGAVQSMMSLPDLQDDQKAYVFHKWEPWDLFNEPYRLYCTVVEYDNEQKSRVTKKNIGLEGNTASGLIAATKNDSLDAWWIITAEIRGTGHYVYKLENDSISPPVYFQEGAFVSNNNASESSSSFTPDGTRYAIFGEEDGLRIYDFDRTTGELSNYQFFDAPGDFIGGEVGLSFSASGRYLYTCHLRKIYQYDMEAQDIGASRLTVADWEESFTTGFPSPFFVMQRAPDCRIYLSARNTNSTIHVIHYPDRRGTACMVQQNIEIPAFVNGTTPSFPNYRLGTGPVCDSTKVFPPSLLTAVEQINRPDDFLSAQISLFPNPSDGEVNIELFTFLGDEVQFHLYNLQGQQVYAQSMSGAVGTQGIRLPNLPSGMYVYSIVQDQVALKTDKLVLE